MSFIGNQPLYQAFVTDQFSGNGSTTSFTMSVAPANPASVLVTVSGVLKDPSTYSVSGNTLTFSQAPPLGSANISTRYLGIPASGVTTTAYRTITDFTATASQTVFTPPSYTVGFINVYQNGVRLGMADYVATNGTTVTLLVAASLNDLITTESFFVSSVLNALPQTGGSILGSLGVSGLATFSGGLVAPGGISNTAIGATTLSVSGNTLLAQSTDQGTGVLQVTGQSTFNGTVVGKSIYALGGNNFLLYSNTFTNAAWAKTAVTVTANSTTAPDGTNTASTFTFTNATNSINQSFTAASTGAFYTLSIYLKAGTDTTYTITGGNSILTYYASCIFNLSTGVAGAVTQFGVGVSGSATMVSVGNGWYRCSLSVTNTVSSWYFYGVGTTNGNYVYAWQAQSEIGLFASSPTITTSSAISTTNNIYASTGQVVAGLGTGTAPSIASVGIGNGFNFITNGARGYWGQVGYQQFDYLGVTLRYQAGFNWSGGTLEGNAIDLSLYRDAANTLAQRNSTNAQTFRLYNTYTDASNYERLGVNWASNRLQINTENAGTGTQRALDLGGYTLSFYPNGTASSSGRLDLSVGGVLFPDTTLGGSLGQAGNVWNNLYVKNIIASSDASINGVTVGLGGGSVSTNIVIGAGALNVTATGGNNIALGVNTLRNLSSGSANSGCGNGSLQTNTTGANNSALGYSALSNNSIGSNNTGVGTNSLYINSNGSGSTAIGVQSLFYNSTGSNHVSIGYNSLFNNTTASNLVAIGTQALTNNTTNVATLGSITGGTGYTDGTYTGVVMTLSSGSSAITYPTATIVVSGGAVTTVTITSAGVGFKDTTTVLTAPAASIGGTGSGFSVPVATLQSGTGNVAVGYQAGYTNSVGTNNTLNGYQAGYSLTVGSNNSYLGYQAGYSSINSSGCTAFGSSALYLATASQSNTAIGNNALHNTTGGQNTAIGTNCAYNISTGTNCVALGFQAGYGAAGTNANTTGSNNTYLGAYTVGSGVANTNEMVIGYQAVGLGSNTTVIGNSSTLSTLIYGNQIFGSTYDQGIGKLQVTGNSTINGIATESNLNLQGGNNNLAYSQDFSNATWIKGGWNVSGTLYTAPDGTTTANRLTGDGSTAYNYLYNNVQVLFTAGTTFTVSYNCLYGTNRYVQLNGGTSGNNFGAVFDLTLGTVTSTGVTGTGVYTSSSINLTNQGFYRITVTGNLGATANGGYAILYQKDVSTYQTGTPAVAANTRYTTVWGAQLELGTQASAYTPTTTTAITTTNNINVPSGQVFAQAGNNTSAPSYSFAGSPTAGLFFSGGQFTFYNAGNPAGYFYTTGAQVGSTLYIGFQADTILTRDYRT